MQNQTKGAILVTGASSGMGQACARLLDQAGYQVFAGVRKASDAEALKREATARLTPLFLDDCLPSIRQLFFDADSIVDTTF